MDYFTRTTWTILIGLHGLFYSDCMDYFTRTTWTILLGDYMWHRATYTHGTHLFLYRYLLRLQMVDGKLNHSTCPECPLVLGTQDGPWVPGWITQQHRVSYLDKCVIVILPHSIIYGQHVSMLLFNVPCYISTGERHWHYLTYWIVLWVRTSTHVVHVMLIVQCLHIWSN
jgi:hypothetical protein